MQPVERAEFEGVDYGWVMQTTFVVTILVGAPIVAVLSIFVTLDSWGARAAFAVRVGAPIWFLTAVVVAVYAKRTDAGDGGVADTDDGGGREENGGDGTVNGEAGTDGEAPADGQVPTDGGDAIDRAAAVDDDSKPAKTRFDR